MTIRQTLLTGAAALALAFGGGAALAQQQSGQAGQQQQAGQGQQQEAQQCRQDLRELDQELAQAREQEGWQASDAWRRDFRQLYDAAQVFAERGDREACEMMVSQMRGMYHDQRARMQEEGAPGEEQQVQREEQLAGAMPVGERSGLMRTDSIVGTDVRNMQNEELGTIDSVVLDPQQGSIAYVLLAHGGFLGIGEEWIPVRWSDLRVTREGDVFVLNVSEEELEQAPTIESGAFDPEAGEDWRTQIDSFWSERTPG